MSDILASAVYNGRYLTRRPTGVDRFANELLRALAPEASSPLRIAIPGGQRRTALPVLPAANCTPLVVGRLSGHAWEQLELSRSADERALVNLCNTGPVHRRRQLTVIHDVAAIVNPRNFSLRFRIWYRYMLALLMRRSRVVATVSSFSRDELRRVFPGLRQQIEIISEGGEHILRVAADDSVLARLQLTPRSYVLAVGSASPNKNLRLVTRAAAALRDRGLRVVAVGGTNNGVFAPEVDGDEGLLMRTGHVSDAQLRALYERAFCFAFPSIYEGFGLPPLEAMWCGCPVIVARSSSLPEVCGDAVLYCDPYDPASLTRAIEALLESPSRRDELVSAGRERASTFSWNRAARQFGDIVGQSFC